MQRHNADAMVCSPPLVAVASLLPAALLPAAAWKMWNFAILMDPRGPAEIRNLQFCAEDVEPACARRSDRRGGARAEDTKPAYWMDAEGARGYYGACRSDRRGGARAEHM